MTILTQKTSNADGVVNTQSSYMTTDGTAAAAFTFNTGFTPRYVAFENMTTQVKDEFYEGMAAGSSVHTVAAGTRTLVTGGNGITIVPGGFTVSAVMMAASSTLLYRAEG
jgi:hypothetical protein